MISEGECHECFTVSLDTEEDLPLIQMINVWAMMNALKCEGRNENCRA
jgi:hypothetical protein